MNVINSLRMIWVTDFLCIYGNAHYIYTSLCEPVMVVGWYHSHPGFGCWLCGLDINMQQNCCSGGGSKPEYQMEACDGYLPSY
ncbi:hypothetical protein M8C21_008531 [Ambrosia artemisiifolia]|uniref:JAB1/MPN/MOV34 metalloenzyme domain-containing protein n=1 Tax=Ambrosia artemisiifolia TaxID=4212 RepID=A0AAD5GMP9_AMBAR|nr:hypothetical protein M8C21_008531 [Ambrosia artemisiifolia]